LKKDKKLKLYGAKKNNLKNISLEIPYDKIVCFTGVSGSGKSSIVFGTIYQEAKQLMSKLFLDDFNVRSQLQETNIDKIEGLIPTIAFKQNIYNNNPRSSVGTYSKLAYNFRNIYTKFFSIKENKIYSSSEFSFNSGKGMCPKCQGSGIHEDFQENKYLDKKLSLNDGAFKVWEEKRYNYRKKLLIKICSENNISVDVPFHKLSQKNKKFLLNEKSDNKYRIYFRKNGKGQTRSFKYLGLNIFFDSLPKDSKKSLLKTYGSVMKCPKCGGEKLKKEILEKKIAGYNISQIQNLSITLLEEKMINIQNELNKLSEDAFKMDLETIKNKLKYFNMLNIEYLSLSRSFTTLSGGEKQRLKIANYFSNDLEGILFIFDEPSAGLHAAQIDLILKIINLLKDKGNYIFLIEHNKKIIENSDHIIELGPFAGNKGGDIVFNDTISNFIDANNSMTSRYLFGSEKTKYEYKSNLDNFISINKIKKNNLKNLNIEVPLNCITSLVGVSGSGKTSLLDVIALKIKSNDTLCEKFKKVIKIDQKPLTKSSRSILMTYIKLSSFIRKIFGKVGKEYGYNSRDFSLNTGKGRCEKCSGNGIIKLEIDSLQQTYVTCPECEGKKYKEEIFEVKYKDKDILEVLELTVEEAINFFSDYPKKIKVLKLLKKFGLGYLTLGESSISFSGGEAQRIKLVRYLSKMRNKNNLIIMDEPSQGLHKYDILNLISTLKEIAKNNTIIIAEHNIEIVNNSDYIIELGPEGGSAGGEVIAKGSVKEISKSKDSIIKDYIMV